MHIRAKRRSQKALVRYLRTQRSLWQSSRDPVGTWRKFKTDNRCCGSASKLGSMAANGPIWWFSTVKDTQKGLIKFLTAWETFRCVQESPISKPNQRNGRHLNDLHTCDSKAPVRRRIFWVYQRLVKVGVVCFTQMNESRCERYTKIAAQTCVSGATTSPDSLILAYRGTGSISLVKYLRLAFIAAHSESSRDI